MQNSIGPRTEFTEETSLGNMHNVEHSTVAYTRNNRPTLISYPIKYLNVLTEAMFTDCNLKVFHIHHM